MPDVVYYTMAYGDVSKWGRLRPPPVADEGSKKEWQRSKFCEANSEQKISGTATGHNGADSKCCRLFGCLIDENVR